MSMMLLCFMQSFIIISTFQIVILVLYFYFVFVLFSIFYRMLFMT